MLSQYKQKWSYNITRVEGIEYPKKSLSFDLLKDELDDH